MIVGLDSTNYDEVPCCLVRGQILDIGPHNGANSLLSRHAKALVAANTEGRYRGLERDRSVPLLSIEQGDITEALLTDRYDCILMLHVLEHIDKSEWKRLFDMLRGALMPGGSLIVGAPYNEEPHGLWGHMVFHITPDVLESLIPDAHYAITIANPPEVFRSDGRVLPWWVKLPLRVLSGDLRKARQQVRGHWHLLAVWRKEG